MADGGNPTVTMTKASSMSKENLERLNAAQQKLDDQNALAIPSTSRPTLTSQHSSSLPSTPYAHPRELSADYRTPSPLIKAKETSSPRSARSESDSTVRSAGRVPFLSGCKYETGMAFSRRRFPYTLGDEPLGQEKQVKKSLDSGEESKLSGDMRELYNRILPSADSDLRRTKLVTKLQKILNDKWPGNDIKVHVFGSSGNLLCSNDSDVDICITTSMKALERMCLLAKTLAEHGMERVVCVPNAKVPIAKIWDPELQLACDMNVNNTMALENTRMIRTYVQIDPRVRPLAMVIKHWTRRRILNDAALGATLSSYTWICLIINFLQTRKPPVLPNLQKRPHQCLKDEHGKVSPFADDLESLSGYGSPNKETLGQLLFHFFRKYGHEMDYEKNVVSVREGSLIPKKSKPWLLAQNKMLGVEEPFNTERNLGNTVDDTSFRGVHLELRRAFEFVSQGKLAEACEQYEFPAHEEKFWSRPAPQPRPVISRSLSQDRRKLPTLQAPNARNQGNNKHRSGPSSRRSSTTVSLGGRVPLTPNPNVHPNSAIEGLSGGQIHDQLIHQYQLLQAQEQHLRMQMHQRQQANVHAQVTVAANMQPLHMPASAYPHQRGFDTGRRQSNVEPGPLSAPLRAMQGLYYPIPSPSQGARTPQPSTPSQTTTNPPSPSFSAAQPHVEQRRGMQRSMTSDNLSPSARSHSQPPSNSGSARSTPRSNRFATPVAYHPALNGQMLPYLHQYQQAFMQQTRRPSELQQMQNIHAAQMAATEGSRHPSMRMDGSDSDGLAPRQYVGYFVDPGSQSRVDRDGLLQPIPAYHDLSSRNRTASASPNLSRLRSHTSRSSSPSRTQAEDLAAASASVRQQRSNTNLSSRSSNMSLQQQSKSPEKPSRNGPLIVDGSGDGFDDAPLPEPSFFHMNLGEEVPSDDYASDTPTTGSVITTSDYPDTFSLEPAPANRSTSSMTNGLHFGELPARAHFSTMRQPNAVDARRASDQSGHAADTSPSRSESGERPSGLGLEFVASNTTDSETPVARTDQEQRACSIEPNGLSTSAAIPSPIPAPLLSPVREVRTPSPTATRSNSLVGAELPKASHVRSVSAMAKDSVSSPLAQSSVPEAAKVEPLKKHATASGKAAATNGANMSKSPVSVTSQAKPSDKTVEPSPGAPPAQISGWQQSTSKKGRKNRKASSVGSAPLMQEQIQRKGG